MKNSFWNLLGLLTGILIISSATPVLAAEQEIRIGMVGPMSTLFGKNQLNGALMAAEEINAKGGVNVGRQKMPIKLFRADSNEYVSVETAVKAMERLVNKDKCHFVIGGSNSEATLAMQDVAMDNKTIFFSAGPAHPELCNRVVKNYDRYKYYFRGARFNSNYFFKTLLHQLKSVALVMNKQLEIDHLKVALLAEEGMWIEPILKQFEQVLPKIGMEYSGTWRVKSTATDLSQELKAIAATNSHIIMTVISGPAGVTLGSQYADMKIPAVVMGVISQAATLKYFEETKGKCDYVMTVATYTLDLEINDLTQPFVQGYYERFGKLPDTTANTYAIVSQIIKQSVESAKSLDPDNLVPIIEKMVVQAPDGIHATGRDERGRPNHDLVWGTNYATDIAAQWQEGKLVAVWPHFKWLSPHWEFSVEKTNDNNGKEFKGIQPFIIAPWVAATYGSKSSAPIARAN